MKYLWFDLKTISDDFKEIDLKVEQFDSVEKFLSIFSKFKPNFFDKKFLRFNYEPNEIFDSSLSSKQKSRLFELLTGFKLNTFKKIQKLHTSIDDSYLYFYDQSHYIKTFKDLTNWSPGEFMERFSI